MSELWTREATRKSADCIHAHTQYVPRVGLILGSGLSSLTDRLLEPDVISYQKIPGFPRSTVAGHSGQLWLGQLGGMEAVAMQGRAHYYEGYSTGEVAFPVRVMGALGVQTLLVTNAAGGIKPGLRVGNLMAITDHINLVGLAGHNPLRGPNDDELGPRFPDMLRAYEPKLLDLLRAEAELQGVPLQEGVYVMVAGPNFETPAEIRFLRNIGADAVGMSMVPEVIVGRHAGMRVLGVSVITNLAIDAVPTEPLEITHDQVLEVGQHAARVLGALFEGVVRRLPQSSDSQQG